MNIRYIFCLRLVIVLSLSFAIIQHETINAQTTVQCGDVIEGQFSTRETHDYLITSDSGIRLIVIGEVDAEYRGDLDVDVAIYAQNGREVASGSSGNIVYAAENLPEIGSYLISVDGIGQYGGAYTLNIACVKSSGEVSSNSRYVQGVQCGTIVESNFFSREYHRYYITLSSGDFLDISAQVGQGYERDLDIDVAIYAQNGREVANGSSGNVVDASTNLPESGLYTIGIDGFGEYGGKYSLYIGCTLADGTVVKPGDTPPVSVGTETKPSETTNFTGYGFSGIAAVDFSAAIEIPLGSGQSQNGAFGSSGSDVFAYTYEASANSTANLSLRRTSGNLSMGVAVINKADNSVVFLAGMPSTGSLTAELQFPSAGTYTIGIFRMDIAPNQVGTSGAFEVRID